MADKLSSMQSEGLSIYPTDQTLNFAEDVIQSKDRAKDIEY